MQALGPYNMEALGLYMQALGLDMQVLSGPRVVKGLPSAPQWLCKCTLTPSGTSNYLKMGAPGSRIGPHGGPKAFALGDFGTLWKAFLQPWPIVQGFVHAQMDPST